MATTPVDSQTHHRSPARIRRADAIVGVLVGAAFLALFFRWFGIQNRFASKFVEDWGHTYIIPLIAGWLLSRARDQIRMTRAEVFWPGLAPLMLGISCYVFGLIVVPNHMVQGFAMIMTLFGVVLLSLGPGMMRWAFLPIAYLVFGVTVSERIMLAITFQLQLVASQGSWLLLNLIGSPFGWFGTEIEGNTLQILTSNGKQIPLNVAEACSGMRMVVAFIALAGFVALVSAQRWWQRIILMLLAAPVAIFMNVVRVTVLGLASLADTNLATGGAHTLIGTLLLFPALLLYMAIAWALERVVTTEDPSEGSGDGPGPGPGGTAGRPASIGADRSRWVAATVTLLVLGGSAAGLGTALRVYGIRLQKPAIYAPDNRQLLALPRETPNWVQFGVDRIEVAEIVEKLGTQNYLNRDYVERAPADPKRPQRLSLHVAYYTGMIDTVPHVPERCFVGGGLRQRGLAEVVPLQMDTSTWLADSSVPEARAGQEKVLYTVRLPSDTRYSDVPGTRVRLPRDVTPTRPIRMRVSSFELPDQTASYYAGYFFVANGGTVPSAEGVRALAFDLRSDYAFYLKVQVSSGTVGSVEEFTEHAGVLIGELIGEFMRCVPDWIEVEEGRYPPEAQRAEPDAG